jgi:hypothetical protein
VISHQRAKDHHERAETSPEQRHQPFPITANGEDALPEREQAFSKFCYQEFGEKADPSLAGGVAMVVTVGGEGVSEAHVQADSWSSKAGKQVNGCLNDKAARAWKIPSDAVKPGQYVVQLAFRPS